ncbi:NADH-quinone oxidoreductase subunit J [candidate division CSSED10-310 bacterium]|uniref:NADH-quinone oxidoreductase subunit J n=1 Tax=candidate division CSSED10-310 bacterium TaxID=2855610 RepID=A0ABV6YY50_UNCC1
MIWVVFIILTLGLISSAVMVIYQKSPVHSALFLILTFLFLAGFYLLLGAEFVAFVHIIVYAGAIMVLFLFVIMLLNLKTDVRGFVHGPGKKFLALFLGGIILFLMMVMLLPRGIDAVPGAETSAKMTDTEFRQDNTESIGLLLYSRYILPFEIASILLVVAMIGGVVLTKKEI